MGFERICSGPAGQGRQLRDRSVRSVLRGAAGAERASSTRAISRRPTPPIRSPKRPTPQLRHDIAFRVIADHVRCLTFALTDGAVPSNEGRGYVLRRILRRAVRFGRQQLELHEPFLHKLVPVVVDTMGDAFPELKKNPQHVVEIDQGRRSQLRARRSIAASRCSKKRRCAQHEGAMSTLPPTDALQAPRHLRLPHRPHAHHGRRARDDRRYRRLREADGGGAGAGSRGRERRDVEAFTSCRRMRWRNLRRQMSKPTDDSAKFIARADQCNRDGDLGRR